MGLKDGHLFNRKGSRIWQLRIYVPRDIQALGEPKDHVETMKTRDWAIASQKAGARLEEKRLEWDALRQGGLKNEFDAPPLRTPTENDLLALGPQIHKVASRLINERRGSRLQSDRKGYGEYLLEQERLQPGLVREMASGDLDRWSNETASILARRGFVVDRDSPAFAHAAAIIAEATLAAIDVENRRDRGELGATPSSKVLEKGQAVLAESERSRKDIPFSDLVKAYMRQWKAGTFGGKKTNTEQQKLATFALFGGYWGNKSIRNVTAEHAAEFRDKVKLLDPHWSRSPAGRQLGWNDLQARFGNQERGLSDATMNRHLATLQSLWKWSHKRGHCDGDNPFDGFHVKLREGVNVTTYLPWESRELMALLAPPPKRQDLMELIIVAMFTGMRLDEIASLTWDRVRSEIIEGVDIAYFEVVEAKTPAGWRQVPVHSALGWLLHRHRSASDARIWPAFNLEGAGKKAGADASKLFSDFKIERGFTDRRKTFHSFRKNVTRIMEHARVPENEWAQVFGHERGFTYRKYNPDGIKLRQKVELIELIKYPGVTIPHPQS